jgi:hypothetical protein
VSGGRRGCAAAAAVAAARRRVSLSLSLSLSRPATTSRSTHYSPKLGQLELQLLQRLVAGQVLGRVAGLALCFVSRRERDVSISARSEPPHMRRKKGTTHGHKRTPPHHHATHPLQDLAHGGGLGDADGGEGTGGRARAESFFSCARFEPPTASPCASSAGARPCARAGVRHACGTALLSAAAPLRHGARACGRGEAWLAAARVWVFFACRGEKTSAIGRCREKNMQPALYKTHTKKKRTPTRPTVATHGHSGGSGPAGGPARSLSPHLTPRPHSPRRAQTGTPAGRCLGRPRRHSSAAQRRPPCRGSRNRRAPGTWP